MLCVTTCTVGYVIQTEISWYFITDSHVLEKNFKPLIGLRLETLFLSFNFLLPGKTEATFALSGKTLLDILLFIAPVISWKSTVADNFTSLVGILSVSATFLSSVFK